uniref:Transposase n=1 Tax=Angiostrongylus cantonensis TaxID=6313 RepID=A0A0K0DJN5_ANGCA
MPIRYQTFGLIFEAVKFILPGKNQQCHESHETAKPSSQAMDAMMDMPRMWQDVFRGRIHANLTKNPLGKISSDPQ